MQGGAFASIRSNWCGLFYVAGEPWTQGGRPGLLRDSSSAQSFPDLDLVFGFSLYLFARR
jgi:hypothetical protein